MLVIILPRKRKRLRNRKSRIKCTTKIISSIITITTIKIREREIGIKRRMGINSNNSRVTTINHKIEHHPRHSNNKTKLGYQKLKREVTNLSMSPQLLKRNELTKCKV